MILQHNRFHGHNSLSYVYRQGATVRNQHMALRYVLNQRRSSYRLAVVVSRKVYKSAVKRNRVRRRIYEIARTKHSDISQPYDMVLTIFSDQIVDMPSDKLQEMIDSLLKQTSIKK